MKRISALFYRTGKHPLAALAVIVSVMVIFVAACTERPARKTAESGSPVPVERKPPLLGTWVSQQWPEQEFTFTEDEVRYREMKYSVVLEGSGNYTYKPGGNVEWIITWYSGDFTQWKGTLQGDTITVEFHNSWDNSQGTDTLVRVQ